MFQLGALRGRLLWRDENTSLISLGLIAALTSYSAARSRMVLRVTAPSSRERLKTSFDDPAALGFLPMPAIEEAGRL